MGTSRAKQIITIAKLANTGGQIEVACPWYHLPNDESVTCLGNMNVQTDWLRVHKIKFTNSREALEEYARALASEFEDMVDDDVYAIYYETPALIVHDFYQVARDAAEKGDPTVLLNVYKYLVTNNRENVLEAERKFGYPVGRWLDRAFRFFMRLALQKMPSFT